MLWAVAAFASGPAVDEPTPEVRAAEIYDNGTLLYDEGLYDDAIAAWQEAYRLSGLHPILLNIANAYERLQRFEEAIAVLNRYRAFARPDEREQIKERVRAIEERMAASKTYVRHGVAPLPIPPLRGPATPREGGPTPD